MAKIKRADGSVVESFDLKCLGYGDSGTMKSTFFAGFPKPMLVFMFDPWGKERPYLRRGRPGELYQDEHGTWITPVFHPKRDEVIITIEHYLDDDPYKPTAFDRYRRRMIAFQKTREWEQYKTIGWDSLTYMEMARRKWDEFMLNPTSARGAKQDGRQWYGASAAAIEDEIARRATMLKCNTFVTAHISDDKIDSAGKAIFTPSAPGKLTRKLPAGFIEVYRFFAKGVAAERSLHIQTQPDANFTANTQIPAPDGMPVEDGYPGLWADFQG